MRSKCWELKCESAYDFVAEQSFELKTDGLAENFDLWNVLRPKGSDGFLYYYEPTRSLNDLEFDDPVEYNTFILKLLGFPYSTNSFRYDYNQHDCYVRCKKELGSNDSSSFCSYKCRRQDCSQIFFFSSYTQRYHAENLHYLWVGNHVLGLYSHPKYTFSLYTLQVLGLVTIFFDLMLLDIKGLLLHVISLIFSTKPKGRDPLERRKKGKISRRLQRWIRRIVPKIIYIGCFLHLVHRTTEFFKYLSSSERRIGRQDDIFMPYISLCFDKSKDVSDKIIPGVSLNVKSYSRLDSSLLFPAFEYSDDQFKCYVLKSRQEYLSNDRLSEDIFQIDIIQTTNNSISISMDHRRFSSSPEIAHTVTNYRLCKAFVIE